MSALTPGQIEARAQLAAAGVPVIGIDALPPWMIDPATTAAVTAATVSRPAPVMEPADPRYFGQDSFGTQIDRYSANPGVDYLRSALRGTEFVGRAPTMFSTGDLPRVTGSGVDPEVLLFVGWKLRHSAAFTPHRSRVLRMIEESDGDDDHHLQHPDGRAAISEYFLRCQTWALETGDEAFSEEQYEALFGEQRTQGS